jgi:subfamily B ATP-binding cassette protein MsbA
MARIGNDPVYVDEAVQSSTGLLREPITFLLLFGYCLSLNWKLTFIAIAVLPPLGLIFSASGKNLKKYIKRLNEETAEIFSALQEAFSGIRMVKLYALEGTLIHRFHARTSDFSKFLLKLAAVQELSPPIVELITSFAIAGVLGYGGYLVLEGQLSPGDLLSFFAAFAMMINPLRVLNDINNKLQAGAAACERIFQVFTWHPSIQEKPHAADLLGFTNELQFENVHFAYPDAPERPILQGISFVAKRGQTLALVGESGAGKSSLINLIPRVFDIQKGCIRIDGTDIRDAKISHLRELVAVVSQDVFLFNDTVAENIRMGSLTATRAEIEEAARRAHAHEFISRLPDGFETRIGDRGQKLSGGERQRLSIARAFLRKSPILILDEATSALDNASEKAVQRALEELMKDRTTLLIAHRLSTVRSAHEILVLSKGHIIERGNHDSLVAQNGEYARLLKMGAME